MNNLTSNIKDTMTMIAAWLIGIGTLLAGLNITLLHLPVWVSVIGGVMVGLGGVINGIYGGKNADGSTKTPTQVITANQIAAETKDIPAELVKV